MPSQASSAALLAGAVIGGAVLLRRDPETGESPLDRLLGGGPAPSGEQPLEGGGGSSSLFPEDSGSSDSGGDGGGFDGDGGDFDSPEPGPAPAPSPENSGPGGSDSGGETPPSYFEQVVQGALDPFTVGATAATVGGFAAIDALRNKQAPAPPPAAPPEPSGSSKASGKGRTRGVSRVGRITRTAVPVGVEAAALTAGGVAAGIAGGVGLGLGGVYALEASGALDKVEKVGTKAGKKLEKSKVGRAIGTAVEASFTPLSVVGGLATAAVGRGTVKGNLKEATEATVRIGRATVREGKEAGEAIGKGATKAGKKVKKFVKGLF